MRSLSLSAACSSAPARLPIGLSHSCLRHWGAFVFIPGDPPAALERIADSALALRAVALLFLPLQKLAKQRLALLRGKIRGWRTFILQERGKIAASHLWVHRILWADTT